MFYFGSKDFNVVESTLQRDMCNIHDWLNANKRSLNIDKTKSILVCSKRIKSTTQEANLSLSVENNPIEQVQSSTYLGVVVDDQFHFQDPFQKSDF